MAIEHHSISPIYGKLKALANWLNDSTFYELLLRIFRHSKAVAEVYQLGSLLFVALVIRLYPGGHLARVFVGAVAACRLADILLRAVHWSFVQAPKPLENAKRSLVMFLINLAEVVMYYALLGMLLECAAGATIDDRIHAIYSSLRTAVTVGPLNVNESRRSCVGLHIAEIVEAYFLTVLIVAGLLSAIRRDER